MKCNPISILGLIGIITFLGCSPKSQITENKETVSPLIEVENTEPHRYGGWYCPDNLNGFPAVDIANWKAVPVVNGRMPTKEETQTETSLIFVDPKKHPNAKVLDMTLPLLARYYNQSSHREELIIVIQAFKVNNDSIVGFRYLNGGNGSAWLSEINLLTNSEIKSIAASQFVSHNIKIEASKDTIWKVLTHTKYAEELRPFFDKDNQLKQGWRAKTNVNYLYSLSGVSTASFANQLYGNFYVQNDYSTYTEKFLLLEDQETHHTEFKIVCGPFGADYETQKSILYDWAQKVKELSEKK